MSTVDDNKNTAEIDDDSMYRVTLSVPVEMHGFFYKRGIVHTVSGELLKMFGDAAADVVKV